MAAVGTLATMWRLAVAFIIVFLGGGLGAALRHGQSGSSAPRRHCISVRNALHQHCRIVGDGADCRISALKAGAPQRWRLFMMTGILGGFRHSPPFRSKPHCSTSGANLQLPPLTSSLRLGWRLARSSPGLPSSECWSDAATSPRRCAATRLNRCERRSAT